MEEIKNKLACDDKNQNISDYCLKIYKESVKNKKYKDEYIPKFMKQRKINNNENTQMK